MDNKALESDYSTAIKNTNIPLEKIEPAIKEIAGILQITIPPFNPICDCFFWDEKRNNMLSGLNDPNQHRDLWPRNPEDFVSALYDPEPNNISLSRQTLYLDPIFDTFQFKDKTIPELTYHLAHEFRHVWQYTYQRNRYYSSTARGTEVLNDWAEIDADAFAIAYIFSGKTDYSVDDFPIQLRELGYQGTMDGGRRWEQAKKLSSQLGFGKTGKISAAKNAAIEAYKNRQKGRPL